METLQKATSDTSNNEYIADATIQRFEYTFELSWRAVKHVLEVKGVYLKFPSDMFAEAFSAGWIKEIETWEDMLEDRNRTSHTYNSKTANQVYEDIKTRYVQCFGELLHNLMGVFRDEENRHSRKSTEKNH